MSGDYAPEIGPDGRERPRFGEYATPEEQRSRIQQPDVTEALSTGSAPVDQVVDTPVDATPETPAPVAASATPRPVSAVNRLATIVLLAFGAANVLFSLFSYLNLAPAIERSMDVLGVPGEFTSFDAARTWGIVAAIVLLAGYVVTAVITWRVLKAGRVSWWIPLVGAVVTFIAVSFCIAVPLMGDPAFIDFVSSGA
ncbi:DUF6264 family protein [Microbacterium sp. SLBN-146]|uniref:DUF6264 family protein n=1 Tax=Microbacterium sp. SLBN-146 TaxID=2768457 RepID=UPI00114FB62B|nr:DUF6264 family protein [Microbacterium sp. SLBN-146]TQJ31694.1 hypothetical protein FBY39_2175 [Microbacterium sp. SLBN-146]